MRAPKVEVKTIPATAAEVEEHLHTEHVEKKKVTKRSSKKKVETDKAE